VDSDNDLPSGRGGERMHCALRFFAMRKVRLKFFCPVTKEPIPWEVAGDVSGLAKRWSEAVRLSCPHCHGEHSFCYREAYIEAAISDASAEPAR